MTLVVGLPLLLDDYQLLLDFDNSHKECKYLVRKEVAKVVDFQKLLKDFGVLTDSKIEKTFNINLRGFLHSYLKKEVSFEKLEEISFVCERLILEEFNMMTDINGDIIVERNVKKNVYEYIIELLKKHKKPMHIDQIFNQLVKISPLIVKSSESVRSHILRNGHFFINTTWSTYGLKEWEKQGLYIGGSIKDLVETFLQAHDEPKHIMEVSEFVTKHRDTNSSNIYSNLQSDPHNRFILFGCGFVGLSDKYYPEKKTQFKKISVAAFRNFKRRYFQNGRSIFNINDLIKNLAQKYGVKQVQIKASIQQRIENGDFYIKDNYLIVKNND